MVATSAPGRAGADVSNSNPITAYQDHARAAGAQANHLQFDG
jgi:hypothetical protein